MRYMGGKARQAKPISEILSVYRGVCDTYHEPFIGGASIFERAAGLFDRPSGADVHPDLVLMWCALLDGWTPPDEITRDDYECLRHAEPSALRGFAGFGCSFGGKWFGGYATSRGDDYCGAAKRGALRKTAAMRKAGATVRMQSFLEYDPRPGQLIYCDPPYAGTTEYTGVEKFDHAKFWNQAHEWARAGAVVLVSEYSAPEEVACVWSRPALQSLRSDSNKTPATEKLFALGGGRFTASVAVPRNEVA